MWVHVISFLVVAVIAGLAVMLFKDVLLRVIVFVIVAFLVLEAMGAGQRSWAQGHHDGHAQYHDKYRLWMQPGTTMSSCCNEKKTVDGVTTGDCYPTQAVVVNGSWRALRDTGQWVVIPDERIIRERNPGSEDAHLCEVNGNILCFVPPDTGG